MTLDPIPAAGDPDGGLLVVGASQAGVQLASTARELGWTAPITLVGAERHLPYQRPPLSKKALLGGVDAAGLALRSRAFFAERDITLVLGEEVTAVHGATTGRGVVTTSTGRHLAFGRLALTTGAAPRRLPIPGAPLRGVHHLRDADDAHRLRGALLRSPRTVVVGGGFIGLEVAATARRMGCSVDVVLADDRVMSRAVSPFISDAFAARHHAHDVGIRTATTPTAFLDDGDGAVAGVELADGSVLPADLVVVGVGAQPRTELAQLMGLHVAAGVVVDQHGLTSDGTTLAAGDCTVWPLPDAGGAGIRFESVNAATEQAKVAAATLTGSRERWTSTPWFWSDQFDLKLQVAGHVASGTSSVVRRDPASDAVTMLHFDGTRLVAVESVNRPADFLAAKAALSAGRSVDPQRAADARVPLKTIVVDHDLRAVPLGAGA